MVLSVYCLINYCILGYMLPWSLKRCAEGGGMKGGRIRSGESRGI